MNELTPSVNEKDAQISRSGFEVTLVEYGDYQCPYCAMAYPMVKQLLEDKGNAIRFVFRNFPIQTIHPYALAAALAAEAAARQNHFWEMHDLLFENQERFSNELFPDLAKKLKLDLYQFQQDISSESALSKVKGDFKSGLHSGVNGTPSFFIDGIKIELPGLTYHALSTAISDSLHHH